MTTEAKKELQPSPVHQTVPMAQASQLSPLEIVQQAKAAGFEVADMKEMLALQKDWEANEARKAFHLAMSEFRKNPPEIIKNKKVSYTTEKGTTEYHHATLDHVAAAVSEGLSEHGLNFSWKTEQGEGGLITVTCTITHRMGHSESTSLSASPDQSGKKNNIQAVGSTISYLERYTLMAITGVAAAGMDDDGAGADGGADNGPVTITEDQAANIEALITEHGMDMEGFKKFLRVEKLEDLLACNYDAAIRAIDERVRNK